MPIYSNKFSTGVKAKATGELTLSHCPGVGGGGRGEELQPKTHNGRSMIFSERTQSVKALSRFIVLCS